MSDIKGKRWTNKTAPKKVLFIRLQALGDTVITMPYIRGFAQRFPEIEIHFLTRKEVEDIPHAMKCIHKVWSLGGGRKTWKIAFDAVCLLPRLKAQGFDIVFDLQNNKISELVRKGLVPAAWSAFDRFSSLPAGERTQNTIEFVGLGAVPALYQINQAVPKKVPQLLAGIGEDILKVIVNPAGFFESRKWPVENYVHWARSLTEAYQGRVNFIFIGIDRIAQLAEHFEREFANTTNLVGKTSVSEAYGLVQSADFMLSEDSGLMHMAWTSGIPTLALFGSSRSDWSRPLGSHTRLLSSDDLACGNCLLPVCKWGDNRCLTRYSPEMVLAETKRLLNDR
ncbi:MAG: lipopolysaccharide heptosyltransferase II [Roseivirga sp.]